MEVHVLNGDALAAKFPLSGTIIVCRECLIEGPVNEPMEKFWNERASFISGSYHADRQDYFKQVRDEFGKLSQLPTGASVNLWFEHDLFCQVNMWFILSLLHQNNIRLPLFRVAPLIISDDIWSGFGRLNAQDLEACFRERIFFTPGDVKLGADLWIAYQRNDLEKIKVLGEENSPCFPYLKEVCNAQVERSYPSQRPQQRLKEIIAQGANDFNSIFSEFSRTEGIYGFGDLQVKSMLAAM
jgi:hypothetical protein